MRFKIKVNENTKHADICTSVKWGLNNEAYSLSDDYTILKWDPNSLESSKFVDLEGYGTDFDFLQGQRGSTDLLAIAFSDGSFILQQKTGKVEKKEKEAHKGAIISIKWSVDGSLATCGEDGALKIWSKTGIIRSNLVQIDKPIYCIVWSPDNDGILYCSDKMIYIKPLQAGQKQVQWKAHDGLVLKVDWNHTNNLILSCGEDCKYKVFDTYGRLLFASAPYDYVITSVAWSPNGDYFAVGAYDMLRLCDKTGWTYSFHKTNQGSILNIAWTSDGTICAGAAGNGSVIFGHVVERCITYDKWEITLTEDNKIQIIDLIDEMNSEFDFKERVINMSMKYNNLIITTSSHCYIYSFRNWNTPYIFDIRDSVSQICQCANYFCLVEVSSGIMVYNYEGRLISNPKIQGTKFEHLSHKKIAISNDLLALVDGGNNKVVKFYEMNSGKALNFTVEHSLEILEINLNQTEMIGERKLAFVDQNRDLHITPVHKKDIVKLAAMTDSFLWNEKFDMLCAISDQRFVVWYYPTSVYVDRDLLEQVKVSKECTDLTRNSQILSFQDTMVQIRRKDGAIMTQSVSPYPALLFEACERGKWEKAIKLCRYVKEHTLWAALAGLSLQFKELNTAEIALAAIEAADKVLFIQKIINVESEKAKSALLALFFKRPQEAENIYTQAKLYYRAIKMNIKLYKWERALDLAIQYNVHQDTLLAYRQKYLELTGQQETIPRFEKLAYDIKKYDWVEIKNKIKQEKAREQQS
ncbi:unnamed protein product [Paramecium primaurelia]|uniref:Intraflagellar transport protein 80 homolog n=1 Tax=Paramecium primaurelia TaxID=5886 RepID=A0A8S1QJQ6_PARPR|nr:unnamed protein product [Paramecium primaurelia]